MVLRVRLVLWMTWALGIGLGAGPRRADAQASRPTQATFYVATDGNDRWSGRLPSPNAVKSDGPFATMATARDAVRRLKATGPLRAPVTVLVRGGTYYLAEPVRFGAQDSGTNEAPVTYGAYPGEQPVLSGGRPITRWQTTDGKVWTAEIGRENAKAWSFGQLRVGDKRQIRARYPNYDSTCPITGGWLFAQYPCAGDPGFGLHVNSTHNVGDYIQWQIDVPADGDYAFWVYVAMKNKRATDLRTKRRVGPDMSGRTVVRVDDAEPVPLMNMQDTGGWQRFQWRHAATLALTKGRHPLRWTNVTGGGVNFNAFALCDDPDWKPTGTELQEPRAGRDLLLVQAQDCEKMHGPQMHVASARCASKTELYAKPETLKRWSVSGEPLIYMFFRQGITSGYVPLLDIDPDDGRLRFAHRAKAFREVFMGSRFRVENVLEELDAPGEWYLDRDSGTLYYIPLDPGLVKTETVASVLDRVIELRGDARTNRPVSHITVRGLTITDTDYSRYQHSWYSPDDAAVWLSDAVHCRIAGCRFVNVGGHAIKIGPGSHSNEVLDNTIAYAGQGGVFLDGAPPFPSEPISLDQAETHHRHEGPVQRRPARNLISGNHIHHCGEIFKHVAGVYIAHGDDNLVSHNYIHDMPRYGISTKYQSRGNIVEFNEVRRTNLETSDAGGIEVYYNLQGGIVRNNLVVDTVGCGGTMPDGSFKRPYFTWGIYLDGTTSNYTVTNNVVVRNTLGGVMINGGSDNVVENNVFTDGSTSQACLNNYRGTGLRNKFRRNVIYYRAPAAAIMAFKCTREFIQSDYNLYCHVGGEVSLNVRGEAPAMSWADWKAKGMDTHSIVADPLFVDPAKDNYALCPDSPAWRLGFEPIDISRIGLRGYVAP